MITCRPVCPAPLAIMLAWIKRLALHRFVGLANVSVLKTDRFQTKSIQFLCDHWPPGCCRYAGLVRSERIFGFWQNQLFEGLLQNDGYVPDPVIGRRSASGLAKSPLNGLDGR